MHIEGYNKIDGGYIDRDKSFNGMSTIPYAPIIKKIIDKNEINSLLDYGCGKAEFYNNKYNIDDIEYPSFKNFWNIDIDLYDPSYSKFSKLDQNKAYDMVICIDVLEHIPIEDIDYVLEQICNLSKNIFF